MPSLNLFPARIPFVNTDDGTLTPEAMRALQIVQDRLGGVLGDGISSPVVVPVTGSPFTYSARQSGSLIVQGGTVTNIKYLRGVNTIDIALLNGKFEMQINDAIRVTYAALPVLTFLPS